MKLKVLVTALALLASTAVANAADNAWFAMTASVAGVTSTSGPGQTLVITAPAGSAVVLNVGYNFTNAGQYGSPTSMNGWAFTLDTVTPSGAKNATFANGSFAAGNGGTYDVPLGATSGATISAGAGAVSTIGLDGLVFSFDITVSAGAAGDSIDIFGDLGDQPTSAGFAWFGSFGPNAGRYGVPTAGYNNRAGELPVITINSVPEPATFALLGLGVVALIRRRR